MTIAELTQQCVDSLNNPQRSFPDDPVIVIEGKGTLFPKGGGPRPKRLLCVNSRGNKVWHYSARDVLAALVANGVVQMRERPDAGEQAFEFVPAI